MVATSANEAPSLRTAGRAILVVCLLMIQGCYPGFYKGTGDISGFSLNDAESILANLGKSKLQGITLGRFYTKEEVYSAWVYPWSCNNRLVIAKVTDLVLTPGVDNGFEGVMSVDQDCGTSERHEIAGRYLLGKDGHPYLYLYFVSKTPRFLQRYRIRKGGLALEYEGNFVVVNSSDVRFEEVTLAPAQSVTGIKRHGSQIDMYETTEFVRKDKIPTETLAERKREIAVTRGEEMSKSAGSYAQATAEETRRNREDSQEQHANTISALNKLSNDYERELKRGRTSPSSVPMAPAPTVSSGTSNRKPPSSSIPTNRPALDPVEPPRTTPMWTYIGETAFEGVGPTRAEGCDSAEKSVAKFSPTMADTKRKLISRKGDCSCSDIQGNPWAKPVYSCRIVYAMEITTPRNPNTKQTTSEGVSR